MNCISCDSKASLEWCNKCNALACVECMYVADASENCERHNFLLDGAL